MNTPHFTNTNIVSKKWTRKAYNPYPISPNTHTHTHPLSFGREEGKKSPKMSLLHHLVGSIAFLLKVLFFCSLVVALNEVLEECINSRQVANCIVLFFFSLERQYSILKRNEIPKSNGYRFSTCFMYNIEK